MAQQFRILQSLWAMERRRADEAEWPLQTQLSMIRDAGFDGVGVRFVHPAFAAEVTGFLRQHGMIWQAQCYPTCIDDLKPCLSWWRDSGPTTSICSRMFGHSGSNNAFRYSTAGDGSPMRPALRFMWKLIVTA